jgi:hypothetical protein
MLRSWYILFFQLPFLPEAAIRRNDYALIEQVLRGTAVDRSTFSDKVLASSQEYDFEPISPAPTVGAHSQAGYGGALSGGP